MQPAAAAEQRLQWIPGFQLQGCLPARVAKLKGQALTVLTVLHLTAAGFQQQSMQVNRLSPNCTAGGHRREAVPH